MTDSTDAGWLEGIMRMLLIHAKQSDFLGGVSCEQIAVAEEAIDWLKKRATPNPSDTYQR
jgi:hypothetical protein